MHGVYKGHSTVSHPLSSSFPRVHGIAASVWCVNDVSVSDLEHAVVAAERLIIGRGCYRLSLSGGAIFWFEPSSVGRGFLLNGYFTGPPT